MANSLDSHIYLGHSLSSPASGPTGPQQAAAEAPGRNASPRFRRLEEKLERILSSEPNYTKASRLLPFEASVGGRGVGGDGGFQKASSPPLETFMRVPPRTGAATVMRLSPPPAPPPALDLQGGAQHPGAAVFQHGRGGAGGAALREAGSMLPSGNLSSPVDVYNSPPARSHSRQG